MVLQQGIITLPCTCCLETEYVETKSLTSIYNENNSTIYIHQMHITYVHAQDHYLINNDMNISQVHTAKY